MQQLNAAPTLDAVRAVDAVLTAQLAQPGLGRRTAIRQRVGAADRLFAAGHPELAAALIDPLARNADLLAEVEGVDRVWLQLWQAAQAGTLSQHAALVGELAGLLGEAHPSVVRWRQRVAADAAQTH